MQRLLHIDNVAPAATDLLEDVLHSGLLGRSDAGKVKALHGKIANIFNKLDRQAMEDVERLSQRARLLLFDEM